jgi:hypothetical protein
MWLPKNPPKKGEKKLLIQIFLQKTWTFKKYLNF